ncbi:MAG: hypothetical protein COA84_00990 [Robiginitomaculum sp.]|nr:MAG: hypothetical protein COA84_00990 [Robiginitomaculum sp.]
MAEDQKFYDQFAKVLGGSDADTLAPWLKESGHVSRLGIHQSNFRVTTTKSMQGIYKAISRLVGDEYFAALMTGFLKENPPSSSSLTHYGAGFADFLRTFAPVQANLPWLAPVARLDWAWFIAYGAANAPALNAENLQNISPEKLPASAPGLHVTATLLRFSVPAYSIWQTNIEDKNVREIDLKTGREWALVWRQGMQIRHAGLTQAQYVFLDAIGGEHSLAQGWTDAMRHDPAFDLSKEFAHWLSAGVFNGEQDDQ